MAVNYRTDSSGSCRGADGPLGRELAHAALFLAGAGSAYVTGQVVYVDGGRTVG